MDDPWGQTLSEVSPYKKANILWLYLYEVLRLFKIIEAESKIVVTMVWGQMGDIIVQWVTSFHFTINKCYRDAW